MSTARWTVTTMARHMRGGLGFPGDVTYAEWAVLEPLLPPPSLVGRPPAWPLRDLADAMVSVPRAGIPGRVPPPCFQSRQII